MKMIELQRQVLRDTVSSEMPDVEVLMRMVVLHTHAIVVSAGIDVEDVRQPGKANIMLAPLTHRYLADLLASLWPPDEPRGDATYWFRAYDRSTPFEVFEDVAVALRDNANAAKAAILAHPWVHALVED